MISELTQMSQVLQGFLLLSLLGTAAFAKNAHAPVPPVNEAPKVDLRAVSFRNDVQPILQMVCVNCHQTTTPYGGLVLEPSLAYVFLVNSRAASANMMRVSPGQPERSYLLYKLMGTHATVGGGGYRMPMGQGRLMKSEMDTLRAWIVHGAKNN